MVTFKDVAGACGAKEAIRDVVDYLRSPQLYRELGTIPPRTVLLTGALGTGKSLFATAVAGEAGVPLFRVNASTLIDLPACRAVSILQALFARANRAAPAVVFLDEAEILSERDGANSALPYRELILKQLAAEVASLDEQIAVVVLVAATRPHGLGSNFLWDGRFDRQIFLELPAYHDRAAILTHLARDTAIAQDVDLTLLAKATTGLSASELVRLHREACHSAARGIRATLSMADYTHALETLLFAGVRPLLLDPAERRLVARHLAGHVLVAWFRPGAVLGPTVTLLPRTISLLDFASLSEYDSFLASPEKELVRLDILLGGWVADHLLADLFTSCAQTDLTEALRLARRLVTEGDVKDLDRTPLEADEQDGKSALPAIVPDDGRDAAGPEVDRPARQLVAMRTQAVRALLLNHHEALDRLTELLIIEETVDRDALARILGPRVTLEPVARGVVQESEEESNSR